MPPGSRNLTRLAIAIALLGCDQAVPPTPSPTESPEPHHVRVWRTTENFDDPAVQAFRETVAAAQRALPGIAISHQDVPGGDMPAELDRTTTAGTAPDVILAGDDVLRPLAEGGRLVPLPDDVDTSRWPAAAVAASTIGTDRYLVPLAIRGVVLFMDPERVASAPESTTALLQLVEGGGRLGMTLNPFHAWGWWSAFGGQVVDDGGRCIAGPEVAEALAWLAQLRAAGAMVDPNPFLVQEAFAAGDLDAMVAGSWEFSALIAAGGEVAVADLPDGPRGPARPLVAVDGFGITAAGADASLAADVIRELAGEAAQSLYRDAAHWVPADGSLAGDDENLTALLGALRQGEPRPDPAVFDRYLKAFTPALNRVVLEGGDARTAVAAACEAMNGAR